MRVLVNEFIEFLGVPHQPGRLIHCTREKAWELKEELGDKVSIWYNWPDYPMSEIDPYLEKAKPREEIEKKSKKDQ